MHDPHRAHTHPPLRAKKKADVQEYVFRIPTRRLTFYQAPKTAVKFAVKVLYNESSVCIKRALQRTAVASTAATVALE